MPTGQRTRDAVTVALDMGDVQRTLLRCMDDGQTRTTRDAAVHSGLSIEQAGRAMSALCGHRYVEPVAPRRWVITEDGRVAIEILRAWNFLALQRRRRR